MRASSSRCLVCALRVAISRWRSCCRRTSARSTSMPAAEPASLRSTAIWRSVSEVFTSAERCGQPLGREHLHILIGDGEHHQFAGVLVRELRRFQRGGAAPERAIAAGSKSAHCSVMRPS